MLVFDHDMKFHLLRRRCQIFKSICSNLGMKKMEKFLVLVQMFDLRLVRLLIMGFLMNKRRKLLKRKSFDELFKEDYSLTRRLSTASATELVDNRKLSTANCGCVFFWFEWKRNERSRCSGLIKKTFPKEFSLQ